MGQHVDSLGTVFMNLGFLFPGQASQKVGMGLDLYEQTQLGRDYFQLANELMGEDIQAIIFSGPEETLKQTRYTQPAIYIVSVILGELLLRKGITPGATAGHSLGEFSALTIAGAFDFATGLELVKLRAESMFAAGLTNPGTMAAIVGAELDTVNKICDAASQSDEIVVPANFNSPGQIVISGNRDAVRRAITAATQFGVKLAVELNVSGAFHSPLMKPAREALEKKLKDTEIHPVNFPVFINVDATPVTKSHEIRQGLIRQLENPVRWTDTILSMRDFGIDRFVEVGPGKVLSGLNRRIDRQIQSENVETESDVKEFQYV